LNSMVDIDDLRTKLNQMTERIVSRLKDRSRYLLNESVYVQGKISIENKKGISFLEFALEGLENYHASLGRYNFPDQYRLTNVSPFTAVVREYPISPIMRVDIELKDEIIKFYKKMLEALCTKGDDKTTYGETVYCDADLIVLMHERINVGRFVAESKIQANPSIVNVVNNKGELRQQLKEPIREQAVINYAREIAIRYDLNPNVVESCFRWLIDKTLEVEIDYLRKKYGSQK
jgi:monofunctional chorismate mutase